MTAESTNQKPKTSETNSSMTDDQLVALFEEKISHLDIKHGNIISGEIIEVNKDYVVVDSDLKSESIVPRFEFEADEAEKPLQVGDNYDLYLEAVENGYGETCLSRDKARKAVEWRNIEAAYEAGEPVLGRITDRVKGGFSIIVNSVKGFLARVSGRCQACEEPGLFSWSRDGA